MPKYLVEFGGVIEVSAESEQEAERYVWDCVRNEHASAREIITDNVVAVVAREEES